MGLITGLLTLPLAPVRGTAWLAQQIAEEADRELFDEDRIRRELMELDLRADEEGLSDEERAHLEDDLLARLDVARRRRAETFEQGF
ncbi:MAG TPA: gas vesicle protein GvpG [Solirubrobacteraceae bacterium]|nr:gas vesicle protein GvpG [Solirubrobacteraceae bacterium]HEV7185789.1 gas vesicle protein GvpG [Leifsonia sp.]